MEEPAISELNNNSKEQLSLQESSGRAEEAAATVVTSATMTGGGGTAPSAFAGSMTCGTGKMHSPLEQSLRTSQPLLHHEQPQTPSHAGRTPLRNNFHRPDNFSYKDVPVFGKPKKKAGMAELLSPTRTQPVIVRRSKSPGRTKEAEEAIRMSTYPDGEPPKPGVPAPIERDDFPAPLAEAVFLPELLRRSLRSKSHRSVGFDDHGVDENKKNDDYDGNEDDADGDISPKLKREILAASKLVSPMVKEILHEVSVVPEKRTVDPRDSSRAPSGKGRIAVPPRFASPVNASPSRTTDRPRRPPEPAPRHRRATCPTDLSNSVTSSPALERRPTSTAYVSGTRSATLPPPGTPGAFVYDPFTDDDDDDDGPYSLLPRSARGRVANGGRTSPSLAGSIDKKQTCGISTGDADSVFERESLYRSSSRSDCYSCTDHATSGAHFERSSLLRCSNMSDSVTVLRDLVQPKHSRKSTASVADGMPFLNAATLDTRKRSESALQLWEEQLFEPDKPYTYEEVRIHSSRRKKGLDEAKLEKYLSTADFETIVGMTREDFYRLPEFKRNDVKRKADLF